MSGTNFWGLILQPRKRYKGFLKYDLRVTQASVDVSRLDDNNSIQVMVSVADQDTKFLLCTLNKQICQVPLNLHFLNGQTVRFTCNGKGYVHLTGYIKGPFAKSNDELKHNITEEDEEDEKRTNLKKKENFSKKDIQKDLKSSKKKTSDDDIWKKYDEELYDSEFDDDDEKFYKLDDVTDDTDDDDDDDDDDEEEEEEEETEEEEDVYDYLYDNYLDYEEDIEMNESKYTIKQKKSEDQKKEIAKVTGKESKKKSKDKNVKMKKEKTNEEILVGNVRAWDVQIGTGKVAEMGKNVTIYYRSRVKLGEYPMVSECLEGDGFSFQVGSEHVMPGVNVGIVGMKVGGKRSLVIPSRMAYGIKGFKPDVPPYATILYDIELLKVS